MFSTRNILSNVTIKVIRNSLDFSAESFSQPNTIFGIYCVFFQATQLEACSKTSMPFIVFRLYRVLVCIEKIIQFRDVFL